MNKMSRLRKMFQSIFGSPSPEPVFKKYPMPGARSVIEGYLLNEFSIKKKNDESAGRLCFNGQGDVDSDISIQEEDSGGVIVFPATSGGLLFSTKDWSDLSIIVKSESGYCVSKGSFVRGVYRRDDGSRYDKTSLAFELLNLSEEALHYAAVFLAREAKGKAVLVKNYRDHKIYVVK